MARIVRLRPSRAALAALGRAISAEQNEQLVEQVVEPTPATTRRPQINHKACDHAQTPKARKACRKVQRAAEAQTTTPTVRMARMGKGKAIHALSGPHRTRCMRNITCLEISLPVEVQADAVTCKKCLADMDRPAW